MEMKPTQPRHEKRRSCASVCRHHSSAMPPLSPLSSANPSGPRLTSDNAFRRGRMMMLLMLLIHKRRKIRL